MKCCSICGEKIIYDPFAYMNAAGEPTISKISIFDNELLLCPKCTNKLEKILIELIKDNNKNNIEGMKKQKVIDLDVYRKKL